MDPIPAHNVDNKSKMVILTMLTIFCISLEVFMHFFLGISTGYTDFFYVLFVLAGIWYSREAVILALVLADIHISIAFFVLGESLWAPLLRSAMFVIITLLVGTLSEELKRTEVIVKENEAVRESEDKYRAFFATSKDCVFITSKDGRFVDFNDETPAFFGYRDREEFGTVNARDLYNNPGQRQEYIQLVEQSGFVKDYALDLRKKDGSIIHSLITTIVRKDLSGAVIGFQGTIKDVTEQRRAEEALRTSEERYRTLAEASPDQIFIDGRDDTIQYVNSAALKLFNRTYEQVVGKPRKDFFPQKIADSQLLSLKKVFETGESIRKEDIIQFGKQELWVDINLVPLKDEAGNVASVLGIARDITEHKRAEEAVKESNERYLSYIKEAAMRLKTPVEVVEQNITMLLEDIKTGDADGEQVLLELQLQVKNMEQIRQNILDLNKTIVDGYGEMSPASKQFLTE